MSETEVSHALGPMLARRPENVGKYSGNFIDTVVCEMRFPLLMELGEDRPPASFIRTLRRDFPQMESVSEISVGAGGPSLSANAHVLKSIKGGWSVSLKQNAVGLEVKQYPGYAAFRDRVELVLQAASPIVDSDFWIRLGLRYINKIPLGEASPEELLEVLNPALVGVVGEGQFSAITEYSGRISGQTEGAGYLFQHGLNQVKDGKSSVRRTYTVDVDVWRSEVSLPDTLSSLDAMHEDCFSIFDWALGDTARSRLMEGSSD